MESEPLTPKLEISADGQKCWVVNLIDDVALYLKEDEIVDLASELVRIPSFTGKERYAAEFMRGFFEGHGALRRCPWERTRDTWALALISLKGETGFKPLKS